MQERAVFTPGELIEEHYTSYDKMVESAKNWQQQCVFQFKPTALEGEHHVFQLPSMQLSYAKKMGGIMYTLVPPAHCITISIICTCAEKGSFGSLPLHTGDIVIYDDTRTYNYFSSDYMEVVSISIDKAKFPALTQRFEALKEQGVVCFKNNHEYFCSLFDSVLKTFPDRSNIDIDSLLAVENGIIATITTLINNQEPQNITLTKGEKAIFDIVDTMYKQMDKNIHIHSLAEAYDITTQTLQVNFKALFGTTPKHFLQLLKLNLAHQDLLSADPKQYTVIRIASKWGFSHMGNFSRCYTELFGENPSVTLYKKYYETGLKEECVVRTEEIF
jgi:AraC-like DNA-binding protein